MLCALGYLKQEHAHRLLQMSKRIDFVRTNASKYIYIKNLITSRAISQEDAIRFMQGKL
jgi:hypothetical protein